jgi:hypothetical protein
MERKVTNPFIVYWNHKRLKLSDGSHQKEFYDHDEAIAFLEAEMNKVEYEKSTPETKAEYRKKYGTEPTQGQLQCTRAERGVILLYGVSDFYIIPCNRHKEIGLESKS